MSKDKILSLSGGSLSHIGLGATIGIPERPKPIRGRLSEDLYGCDSAQAIEINVLPDGFQREIGFPFQLYDPLNKVAASLVAVVDAYGELCIPSGTCFTATWYDDSQQWEVDDFGLSCDQGSGSDEGSEGSGSEEQHLPVSLQFVTDVDYNSITGAWRKKTRTVKLPDEYLVGYETDWVDYILGSDAGSDIQRDATTTTSEPDAGAAYGDVTTIPVAVSPPSTTGYGTPTGSVAFRAYYGTKQIQLHADTGSPYLAAGVDNSAAATITTHLPPGVWTILAEYGGDASYNKSTYESYNHSLETGDQFTVARAETNVTVELDNATPVYGSPITITAYVTTTIPYTNPPGVWEKEPSGFIVFYVDDVQVAYERLTSWTFSNYGAKAVLTSYSSWDKLSGGAHTIKARYLGRQPGFGFGNGLDFDFESHGDDYYTASENTTTVTVSKKPLVVSGGTPQTFQGGDPGGVYTREYGEANPNFIAGYTGFVYGQNVSCLGGLPDFEFATDAYEESDVGIYEVTPTVGDMASDNYSFDFLEAHLTITKATLSVSVDDAGMIYGDTVPEFVVHITGLKNDDNTVITGTATCSATSSSPPTGYVITVGLEDTGDRLKNYWTPTLHHGLLTIAKAELSVMADPQAMSKDGTLPTFTGSVTGVLNSDGIEFEGSCSADGHTSGYFTIYAGVSDPNSRASRYTITYSNSVLFVQ